MNWHNILVLYTALSCGVTVIMVLCNPFFENKRLFLWTILVAIIALGLITFLVGAKP